MKPRTGRPRNIATVVRDTDALAWNVVMREAGAVATFAALDRDHANELAALVNACAWVTVRNEKVGEA